MSLCPPCREAWLSWLDYRITPPVTLVQIGTPNARDVNEARRARTRQWQDTIRFQQGLIEQQCAEGHHRTGDDHRG